MSTLEELMMRVAQVRSGVELSGFHCGADYREDLEALGLPDLVAPLRCGDLAELSARARTFDRRLRAFLVENGAALNDFAGLGDLQSAICARQV